MPLTDNVKKIYVNTGKVEYHYDQKEYVKALGALVNIEKACVNLRFHITRLQQVTKCAAHSAGGD